jgi:ATP-binding protein involved in chromosome partitioning
MAFGKNSADKTKRKAQHEEQKKQIRERLRHIKHKILVMSGKGGVGKSSVAAYLAVSLAKRNYNVGLMDVDLHGPSIPRILGLTGVIQPGETPKTIFPLKYLPNMDVVSIETLVKDRDAAMIWRGPLKGGVIRQFIADVDWNDLDYLIIDSPPGTGDEPLTVAQTIPDAKALIVTTPQELSLADVRKSINFCRQVHMEILGLLENMSGLQCPYCGKVIDVFKQHGGRLTAENENLRLLATLPLVPEVVDNCDSGDMRLLDNRNHPVTQAFNNLADEVISLTANDKVPIIEPAA